jgi:hypothetical protein
MYALVEVASKRLSKVNLSAPNKLINRDKKQLAVFIPQHFSQQFFAHKLTVPGTVRFAVGLFVR